MAAFGARRPFAETFLVAPQLIQNNSAGLTRRLTSVKVILHENIRGYLRVLRIGLSSRRISVGARKARAGRMYGLR
jgi:hypothetical protein